jgi:uncharacterized membrane protein
MIFAGMEVTFMRIQSKKDAARVLLAFAFMIAACLHFISDVELQIIPPFLPWRRAALYITGALEFLGGVGLLIPRFQRAAAWGLVALLVAVFPANIYHAVAHIKLGGITDSSLYHWIRLPLQGVFIWWALWYTRKKK